MISLPGSFHVGDEADEPENGQRGEDLRDQLRPVPTHVQETLQFCNDVRNLDNSFMIAFSHIINKKMEFQI